MDLLLRGGTVVTMDAGRRVVAADVLVRDGRIALVGPHRHDARRPARVIDARGLCVLPGLVQAHVHLVQTLFRGMADDLPLLEWLRTRIWPLEAAHDARSVRASAELGLLEMLEAGTTTILDMGTVHDEDVVLDAMARSGVRGLSGKAMMDRGDGVPRRLAETTKESLRSSEALANRWDGARSGRLGYAYAPRFILSCSERLFRETAELAASTGAIVHTHAAEHGAERAAVRELLGDDDIAILARWGVTGPRAVLAHGVQLRADEMKELAARGTRLVHCPSANMKLASGIAPIQALRAHGVVVALGADGAPCNNRMDPWTELRQAALLAKARERDAEAVRAPEALAMATIDGARALGLEREIGSVEVGKRADLVVVDVGGAHAVPGGDPMSRLVYSATARDVRHVIIDGRWVVRDGACTTLEREAVVRRARTEAERVARRAGLA